MTKLEIEQMMAWYQELLEDDVRWNCDVRILNSNPAQLLDMKLLSEDVLSITYKEQVRIKEGEANYDPKYVNYRHEEKTITPHIEDHESLKFLFNWIQSAANQLLPRLSSEKIAEIIEYLQTNELTFYSHKVTRIEEKDGKFTLYYVGNGCWEATRYSLHELYSSMYHAKHPEVELNRVWALRNFYKMWITFYPELVVEDEEDEDSLYYRIENDYWSRFNRGGIQSVRKMNWKAFLKKHDPVNHLKVIDASTKDNAMRVRKLEALALIDDDSLTLDFRISDFEDELFGPFGHFPNGCGEISEAQYAKLMMVAQPQIETKEENE